MTGDYTRGAYISTFTVRPISEKEHNDLPSGRRSSDSGDTIYFLVKLDETVVETLEPITITVRMDRGAPRLVYIDGGHPLYETWVKDEQGNILGHFGGLLAAHDEDYIHGDRKKHNINWRHEIG